MSGQIFNASDLYSFSEPAYLLHLHVPRQIRIVRVPEHGHPLFVDDERHVRNVWPVRAELGAGGVVPRHSDDVEAVLLRQGLCLLILWQPADLPKQRSHAGVNAITSIWPL
ncbi:hypothetical protein BC937DRAFT_94745 [Endogone sp. FLAS-F59071]|nr:hypothetical protein BC937DRAFT_94745 [Endogone sp. FLAS-F59071]|eukprot:RUS20637.1 hypothetical protein BC937DRAFT_94745 [Endogone sp. FLAS-F59071]